jgi:hypothetical protein
VQHSGVPEAEFRGLGDRGRVLGACVVHLAVFPADSGTRFSIGPCHCSQSSGPSSFASWPRAR